MTTLLVASGGGHLKQLHRLLPRLDVDNDRLWVTFDTGLSRSLLSDEQVEFAPYAHPHDAVGSMRDAWFATRLLSKVKVTRAVSTGANLAVTTLPIARMKGAVTQYIESATRYDGPSLTGRMMQRVPGVALYTQHERWAGDRWHFAGSVFDGFTAAHVGAGPKIRKLVVTLGSNDSYPFPRLVDRLQAIIPSDVEVLWQLGSTHVGTTGGRDRVPVDELEAAMGDADAVVAHAGTGAAISALESGKLPVLVPRRMDHGEHVDNHQALTTFSLQGRGLCHPVEAGELAWTDIETAAAWRVSLVDDPPPFSL